VSASLGAGRAGVRLGQLVAVARHLVEVASRGQRQGPEGGRTSHSVGRIGAHE
jgi:hypothetical protein